MPTSCYCTMYSPQRDGQLPWPRLIEVPFPRAWDTMYFPDTVYAPAQRACRRYITGERCWQSSGFVRTRALKTRLYMSLEAEPSVQCVYLSRRDLESLKETDMGVTLTKDNAILTSPGSLA